MEERSSHITVVVGASSVAEELRRSLVQSNVEHAGIATHLRGLRRSIVLGESDLVIICIAMDAMTLDRHSQALQALLADHQCLPNSVRSVGLLTEVGLTADAASIGCDVYVHDSTQAQAAVELLADHWIQRRDRQVVESNRFADQEIWTCGNARLPGEFEPLLAALEKASVGVEHFAHGRKDEPLTK